MTIALHQSTPTKTTSLGTEEQRQWLAEQFRALTVELEDISPSQWAEQRRYLPASVTPMPGYYRFAVAPYLREIVDCLSVESPVRDIAIMKGAQVGATSGILENGIGYFIEHVKNAPVMMVTADAELAKLRMESYITPMIQQSGLSHLIKSADEGNARKSGKTDAKIEWIGGGFLVPFGAQNANKLRSISIRALLMDEPDGWPDTVGKDGDPVRLAKARTAAYESSRKVLMLSTPTLKGLSKIEPAFLAGDQRYYFVCCQACGFPQVIRWKVERKDGKQAGIVWDMDGGRLVPGSVRYHCVECLHAHTNDDKVKLLSPDEGAEWRPTATPQSPDSRSYHISALYSPVGMQSWEMCVAKFLEAWDLEHNRVRDTGVLQTFYNNILGEPFELMGSKLKFEQVSSHRRAAYRYGEVPNTWAQEHCGSPVLLVVCSVDVHDDNLAVKVTGWCRDRRAVMLDYWRFEGETERIDEPATWGRLSDLIEQREYVADDGKHYKIQLTFIDGSYRPDTVGAFCNQYEAGVFLIKGRRTPVQGGFQEFSAYIAKSSGAMGFHVTVDLYKERWAAGLKKHWSGVGEQPETFWNAPQDATDKQLKELTVETKTIVKDDKTGKVMGFIWKRPSGADNELWDLLVYSNAALDALAFEYCTSLGLERVDWTLFWDDCEKLGLYYFTE